MVPGIEDMRMEEISSCLVLPPPPNRGVTLDGSPHEPGPLFLKELVTRRLVLMRMVGLWCPGPAVSSSLWS